MAIYSITVAIIFVCTLTIAIAFAGTVAGWYITIGINYMIGSSDILLQWRFIT